MLRDKLTMLKTAAAAKISPEVVAVMQKTTEKLGKSDIFQRVIKVGDKCPDFSLADENGTQVELSNLLKQGPVFLSIYRGVW